jgi:hypothetical protein
LKRCPTSSSLTMKDSKSTRSRAPSIASSMSS